MWYRRAAWFAVVAAGLVSDARGATAPATQETQGPLRIVTFDVPEGAVRVYLPADLAAGDTLSGTVAAEPRGEAEPAREANRAALDALRLELGGRTGRVVGGEGGPQAWELPAAATSAVTLRVLAADGRTLGAVDLPVAATSPAAAGFTLPVALERGKAVPVAGAFDGDAGSTTVRIDDAPATVLAESPRAALLAPPEHVGLVEVVVEETGVTARGTMRIVGIDLGADRLDLGRGQSTPLRVTVSGLAGLEEPLEVRVTNRSPAVVTLEEGETSTLDIHPGDVSAEGTLARDYRLVGRSRGGFSIGSELTGVGPPRAMETTTTPPVAGSSPAEEPRPSPTESRPAEDTAADHTAVEHEPGRADATSHASGPSPTGDAVLVAAGDPCDPAVAVLLSKLAQMERLLGQSREELLANPLVQEVLAYQTWLELAGADDGVRRALDTLLGEGVEAFIAEIGSAETRNQALRLLQRLARHLERDPGLGRGLRGAFGRLAEGLERVIEAAGDAEAARERLEALLAELREALDDPLEYLREQTLGVVTSRLQEQLALRFGAKAAGALASMAADLGAFVDALLKKGELDERRRALVELRRKLVEAASRDPCFTLDERWLAEARAGDKGIVFPTGWAGREVTLTARLVCLDGAPPKFVACRPSPVTLTVGAQSGSTMTVTVPAPRAGQSSAVVLYSLAIGGSRCGSHCFVEIQVVGAGDGTVFGLFIGALPVH